MINLYDANNVLMRRATGQVTPGQKIPSIRVLLNQQTVQDVWVWDGWSHNDRRRALYPLYKAQRVPPAEDIFSQIQLFRKLLVYTPAIQVCCDGWEADDVLATIAKRGAPVTIHTNDLDAAQLRNLPNVHLNGVKAWDYDPKYLPLYKALVGDPADNITGIPGFGPKTWDNILPLVAEFQAAVVAGKPEGFRAFPLKPQITNWLADQTNVELLQNMLTITYFFKVPDEEIEKGLTIGKPNPQIIHQVLSEYLL